VVGDGRRRLGTTANDAVDTSDCSTTTLDEYRRNTTKRVSCFRFGRNWSAMVGDDWGRLPTTQWTRPVAWQRHPTMTDAPRHETRQLLPVGPKVVAMVGDDWERLPTTQWTSPVAWQ